MHIYRLNAVGREGRTIVLGTVDTATQALVLLRAAFDDHPRVWVTDECDFDVNIQDLLRRSNEEQSGL